jgi:hypothetical protein
MSGTSVTPATVTPAPGEPAPKGLVISVRGDTPRSVRTVEVEATPVEGAGDDGLSEGPKAGGKVQNDANAAGNAEFAAIYSELALLNLVNFIKNDISSPLRHHANRFGWCAKGLGVGAFHAGNAMINPFLSKEDRKKHLSEAYEQVKYVPANLALATYGFLGGTLVPLLGRQGEAEQDWAMLEAWLGNSAAINHKNRLKELGAKRPGEKGPPLNIDQILFNHATSATLKVVDMTAKGLASAARAAKENITPSNVTSAAATAGLNSARVVGGVVGGAALVAASPIIATVAAVAYREEIRKATSKKLGEAKEGIGSAATSVGENRRAAGAAVLKAGGNAAAALGNTPAAMGKAAGEAWEATKTKGSEGVAGARKAVGSTGKALGGALLSGVEAPAAAMVQASSYAGGLNARVAALTANLAPPLVANDVEKKKLSHAIEAALKDKTTPAGKAYADYQQALSKPIQRLTQYKVYGESIRDKAKAELESQERELKRIAEDTSKTADERAAEIRKPGHP